MAKWVKPMPGRLVRAGGRLCRPGAAMSNEISTSISVPHIIIIRRVIYGCSRWRHAEITSRNGNIGGRCSIAVGECHIIDDEMKSQRGHRIASGINRAAASVAMRNASPGFAFILNNISKCQIFSIMSILKWARYFVWQKAIFISGSLASLFRPD